MILKGSKWLGSPVHIIEFSNCNLENRYDCNSQHMENVSDKIVIYEKLLCTSHICWDFWIICLFLAALTAAI